MQKSEHMTKPEAHTSLVLIVEEKNRLQAVVLRSHRVKTLTLSSPFRISEATTYPRFSTTASRTLSQLMFCGGQFTVVHFPISSPPLRFLILYI